MTRRVAIVGMFLESNAFARPVDERRFRGLYLEGDDISVDARSEHPRNVLEVVGFYDRMDRLGPWEPVPLVVTIAGAGGAADHDFFERTVERVRTELTDAGPLDAVYLCNHGAMITTEQHDADGVFFAAVRDVVGPDVSLVGTLDPHGNVSELMVDALDLLVAYRTDPHVDQRERGAEAAELLHELWGGMTPHPVFVRLPIVAPNVALFTDHGPFAELVDAGQAAMSDDVCNVSILGGFAFSDTSKNGLAIIVTGRDTPDAARRLARELADLAWANRHRFVAEGISIDEAVNRAVAGGEDSSLPAMVLSDLGDNAGAGGPANTVWMLEALHRAEARGALVVNFRDRHLVTAAQEAGVGAEFDATFTGDDWSRPGRGDHRARTRVVALHDGPLVGRRGIVAGKTLTPGAMALLDVDGVLVIVTSYTAVGNDPVYAEALGIDLSTIRTIVVKVRSSFPVAYDEFVDADHMLFVDTPGRTSPMLKRMPFERLPRPVLPLDDHVDWSNPLADPASSTERIDATRSPTATQTTPTRDPSPQRPSAR